MPADQHRVKDLFVAALELPDAQARQAFLDRECGDNADLRQRLNALLAAHDDPNSALNQPLAAAPPELTGAYTAPAESVGAIIADKYKLLQEIGEGGMGSVFMADQLHPVKRRVAIKIIKAGMDSARVLARFEAERQALALMDHPNIAKVLDAGATATNRPFFVMELVKGVPLTQFCDEHKSTVLDRLNLFQQICSAVQHAHQKGIIHRDLKPTNILVESHDGKPVPKVIDFGLAKATSGAPLTEHTLFTALGTVAGTPLYMAPEQAAFNAIDVDTRADIYALGVILYELLTGTTPIERATFKKAAFDEMLRVIREQEPPTPSSRISSSETRANVAAMRGMEPAKLGRFVKGELDWIVMKALAKDRDRRYETATGFAKDVERFLNHEPVIAGPPSASYRLKKFVRRNRPQVIAGSLVLLTLVAGIIGTTWGMVWANRAQRNESEQRQIADSERKKAEQAEADTLADYRASTDDAIEHLIGSKPDLGPQEKTYLENTLKRWQAFADRQGDDERSRAIRAEGHARVAGLWLRLRRNQEALAKYETARDLFEKLAEQFPTMPAYRQDLANVHDNLGGLLNKLGKYREARTELETARDIRKKLVEQFPAAPDYQQGLAGTYNNLGALDAEIGNREEARREYQAAREIDNKLVEQFPSAFLYQQDLVRTRSNLGTLLKGLGKREEALVEYQAARDTQKKLVEQFPGRPEYQYDLARTHHDLAILLFELGKREETWVEHHAARDLMMKLVEQFPAMPEYRLQLASAHNNMGQLLYHLGTRDEARVEYESSRDLLKKLVAQFPAEPMYQLHLSAAHDSLGTLLYALRKHDEARAEYQAGRDVRKKLVERFPRVPMYQITLGGSYCNYGNLLRDEGKPGESVEWFDLAVQTLQPVHDKEPRDVTAKNYLRNSYWGRARAFDLLKKLAEADKDWERVIELSPPDERPIVRSNHALFQMLSGRIAEAVAEVAELTAPVANVPGSPKWPAGEWYDFACIYAVASGKIADKKQAYSDRAMELLRKAVQAGYKDAVHMTKDTDLDALRGREDFKKLIADLEKSTPPKAKP